MRKVFDYTHSVTELLQAKSNDIVIGCDLIASLIDVISNARINIDFLFEEQYKHGFELAQKVSIDEAKPRVCSKQTDRENQNVNSIADYNKVSLAIPLIDIVLSELKRRFEGNQTFIFSGLHIIPYIMASSPNWRDHFKDFLKFYKDDFENTSLSTANGELQLWVQHSKKRCLHLQLEVPCCCNGLFHSLFTLTCILKTSFVIFQALPSPAYGNYFYIYDSVLTLLQVYQVFKVYQVSFRLSYSMPDWSLL